MTDHPAALPTQGHANLTIDQQLALKTAAARLQDEFADTFSVETIEKFLH